MNTMEKYVLASREDFKLISQTGVQQYLYPPRHSHNAIWDSNVGPDGKLYFGLASEICNNGYVRFCSYDYHTNETTEHFKVEDVIMPQDRAIRASKFHSSICFMPDGRIIMTTHTTDKAPSHPTWMPIAHYHHLWEGFAGGAIVIYDPKTDKAECLGIPVPHESIYGSVYEPAHNAVWFLGIFRGHLYRYSLDDKTTIDFGKVTENYAFRLVIGTDGNVYSASRTGHLYRANTETLELEDLDYQFKHCPYDHHSFYNNLSIAHNGPDGRLYMAGMYSGNLIAFDPKTDTFEDMGSYLRADRHAIGENRHGIFGMDFDADGVLWYVVTSLNNFDANLPCGMPNSLYRWDITRGGEPEWLGVVGTPQRACAWCSELAINHEGIMFITGTNHALDGPDITAINLNEYKPTMYTQTLPLTDPYFDPDDEEYIRQSEEIHRDELILAANPTTVAFPIAGSPALLWRALAPKHIEDSAVKSLFWKDNETVCGICGEKTQYAFTVKNCVLECVKPLAELTQEEQSFFKQGENKLSAPVEEQLPYQPGRQYKAVATADATLFDGRRFVGTLDGMAAIIKEGSVFCLGAAAVNGPIHCLTATPDGKTVYGVAGDEMDLASLFSYNDQDGLKWLGYMDSIYGKNIDEIYNCTHVTSCAVSPDGKYLAIGADERLGTVVVYTL